MGIRPFFVPSENRPCQECAGTGRLPNDLLEAKAREVTAKVGMVYFIRDDASHRIKIGTSINPFDRLRALQTGSSARLRLMAICEGGRKGEREFHERFDRYRLTGEWFDDANRQITRILLMSLNEGSFWPDPEEP